MEFRKSLFTEGCRGQSDYRVDYILISADQAAALVESCGAMAYRAGRFALLRRATLSPSRFQKIRRLLPYTFPSAGSEPIRFALSTARPDHQVSLVSRKHSSFPPICSRIAVLEYVAVESSPCVALHYAASIDTDKRAASVRLFAAPMHSVV
jgi:hypothetical protein